MKLMYPQIIDGGSHSDSRGTLWFVNDFHLDEVKRFYIIEHSDPFVVRAWQGHKREQKWFYVLAGSFKIVLTKPDNWDKPSPTLDIMEYTLSSEESRVLYVPGGYANGLKANEANSRIIVFSDFTLEQSGNDSYKFAENMWFDWHK